MKPNQFFPKFIQQLHFIIGISLLLFTTGCGSKSVGPEVMLFDSLPPESPRGYVDVYCTHCLTGWTVYRLEENQEVLLGECPLEKERSETIQTLTQMKRIRIAHPPGSYVFSIKIPSQERRVTGRKDEENIPKKIPITIVQDQIKPLRVDYRRKTEETFTWEVTEGAPLPKEVNADSIVIFAEALRKENWETRWFATQIIQETSKELSESLIERLDELTTREEFRRCIKSARVEECSLIRETAYQTLKQFVN